MLASSLVRARFFVCLLTTVAFASAARPALAHPHPSGVELLAAMESTLVEAIAKGEKSMVAIAVFKQDAGNQLVAGSPELGDVPDRFGTGVVVDRRGLILTNYHVLRPDEQHWVVLPGRRAYLRTRIKAADPRSDLAILEIVEDTGTLPLVPITFGDASTLKKGRIVIALGNPYAIARDGDVSASWGIVANLQRKAPPASASGEEGGRTTLHEYGTLIQTDAKLNLGTSGGALLNLKGEMVGLTTSLAAVAGYEKSAGYAIPVDDTFRRAVETLKQGREVEYGFLGVGPDELGRAERLRGANGIVVSSVVAGLPARDAGLITNDVITHVNGVPLRDIDDLMLEIGRQPAGEQVRLDVRRENRRLQVPVTLVKYNVGGKQIVTERGPEWRGLRVDYLSAHLADSELLTMQPAVCVTEVAPESPAWKAGIREGNRIDQVAGQEVATPAAFYRAAAAQAGNVTVRLADEGIERPTRIVTAMPARSASE